MGIIPHKRGDTFYITNSVPLAFGQLLTQVRSQIRSGDTLVYDLTPSYEVLTPTDTLFRYRFKAPASATALWPIRDLSIDIEYHVGEDVDSTDTFTINMRKDITWPS